MIRPLSTVMILMLSAAPLSAEPLANMDGTWRGTGWAKETAQGPKETVRCQIRNQYDAEQNTLKLKGKCIVPGRRLNISGTLIGADGTEKITGSWSNPDGIGSVRINGIQRDNLVAFTFKAKDPDDGRDLAQNVMWRMLEGTLRLQSTDRQNTEILMSDIVFSQ